MSADYYSLPTTSVIRVREALRRAVRGILFSCAFCSAVVAFVINVQNPLVLWWSSVLAGFCVGIPAGLVVWIVIRIVRFAFNR